MKKNFLDKKRFLYDSKEFNVSYYKGWITVSNKKDNIEDKIKLPCNKIEHLLAINRITERLLRLEPRFAEYIGKSSFLMSFHGCMYRISNGQIIQELTYRPGMNNPLSICVRGTETYFGEYWGNPNKEAVSIFKRDEKANWVRVFSFKPGEVCHIHQIVYDKYRKCFWICTGDKDDESAIWKAEDDFKNVKKYIGGSQQYRTCFIVPQEDCLLYLTDSPNDQNWLYLIKPVEKNILPRKVAPIPGPCIYGKVIDDKRFIFSTSVEPDSTLSKWKYRLLNKLGKGIEKPYSNLIIVSDGKNLQTIDSIKKDNHNMWLFQFGNMRFISGNEQNTDEILVSPIALNKADGGTFKYKI